MNSSIRHTNSSTVSSSPPRTATSPLTWHTEQGPESPVNSADIDASKNRKSLKHRRSSKNAAFYTAAQPKQAPLMFFDVKYYGVCRNLSTNADTPVMVNVTRLIKEKKDEANRLGIKCYSKAQMYFSEKGLAVIEKNASSPLASWFTRDLASMASVKYPGRSNRRIALMKVRGADGVLVWHLFKYGAGKNDNMSECFRFIVDCSLREIGRAVATGATDVQRSVATLRTSQIPSSATPSHCQPTNAWSERSPPPKYAPVAQRELNLDHVNEEARAEALDILEGQRRLTYDV